eukprot:7873538-Pyramimonas_sp.AAC.1
MLYWARRTRAGGNTGTFGGVSYGATKGCTGWWGRMWAVALGPSVKLFKTRTEHHRMVGTEMRKHNCSEVSADLLVPRRV